jgi:hypothetical protein
MKTRELARELAKAIRDLTRPDQRALQNAIGKRVLSVYFFDEVEVREKARVWCDGVMNVDPTEKLQRFQHALRDLSQVYDREKS